MERSFDYKALGEAVHPHVSPEHFNPELWVGDVNNIAFTDGEGSFALFELVKPGIYYGHYFFVLRGKAAIAFAKECLGEVFRAKAKVIVGLTPVENRAALWMNRHLRFESHGEIDTDMGRHEMFIMTEKDYHLGRDLR